MQDGSGANTVDLSGLDFAAWIEAIEELGEERGYFEPLGKRHSAILTDEGPTLLVTFETVDSIREGSESHHPMGWELVARNGWSNLCLMCHGDTWFRDRAVYGYFDRLVDDGFFEDFDRVIFYGAGACGYAAAAFSVAAPGATVIAIAPQATLEPRVAGWDDRFRGMRRTSFTDRYGFAPEMAEAAERLFLAYDPEVRFDAMHAALFRGPNVTHLRCPRMGDQLEAELWNMGVLATMIEAAGNGGLQAQDFWTAYRARRSHMSYLRTLLGIVTAEDRPVLTRHLCRHVLRHTRAPRFRYALRIAEKRLKEREAAGTSAAE